MRRTPVNPLLLLAFLVATSRCCAFNSMSSTGLFRQTSSAAAAPSSVATIAHQRPSPLFCRPLHSARWEGLSPRRPLRAMSLLSTSKDSSDVEEERESADVLIVKASIALRKTSWVSWWGQVILSTVTAVTLLFAKSVMDAGASTRRGEGLFLLPGLGISLSVLSIIWTWGGARLARRLIRQNPSRISAANMTRRAIMVGTIINLLGLLVTLVGAEQIIGTLAAKVLTMQGVSPFGIGGGGAAVAAVATQTLQPLDILVVQGNTNNMLSHFVSLVCTLYMTKFVDMLDPPSTEQSKRKTK